MEDNKWYLYLKENYHKLVLWFVFLLVTGLLIFLGVKIISKIPNEAAAKPTTEEIKIIFKNDEPDSLLYVLKDEVENIHGAIESMRADSIMVAVQKVSK